MASRADPFALVGTCLDGKYDVESVVAEGGFGVVYRAVHRALQKPVAVKVLKTPPGVPESARHDFIEKFVFEARTIARLDHPGIVRVIDFGGGPLPSGDSAPWLVLEWIDGQTMEDDFAARRPQGGRTPMEALALLRPVFEALAVAHDEGVAHRDLKPANVMLARTRRGVEPKLLDFGIAKAMGADDAPAAYQTATQRELRAFTLAYAAPEQLGGTRTGPWTDVHALALLLVEAIVGRAPLAGEDDTALCAEVLSPVRPTPARFGVGVGAWEPVLAKALALRAAERFQHAGELLRALEAVSPSAPAWNTTQRAPPPMPLPELVAASTLLPTSRPTATPTMRSLLWPAVIAVGLAALATVAAVGRARPREAAPATTRRLEPPPATIPMVAAPPAVSVDASVSAAPTLIPPEADAGMRARVAAPRAPGPRAPVAGRPNVPPRARPATPAGRVYVPLE